ncbi:sigma-70 family RNA polymerase sigma factor [Streptomyces sp. NPDC051976]|uniref:sigma-70 family RNA polymerase sigma factor n=1 Tax=Streptomyces sp. NPDC051976 TaxID=3154947 RepID=UPI00342AC9B3
MESVDAMTEPELLAAARTGDPGAFDRLVAPYRRELLAHCYRMLGSVQDAEDALQESLLGAWRGIGGFEGRSSLRGWLYRVCTNACLRLISRRPRRVLSPDHGPARQDTAELGAPVSGPIWLEPWPDDISADTPHGRWPEPMVDTDDPAARYLRRESVELAFVAALQFLPGTQRAVLILREVLEFSAAETARMLDTTPASVNSALQRARKAVGERTPGPSQRDELAALGDDGCRALVDAFVAAWERADVPALLTLLTEDARFTMPPLPAWFDGRDSVARFLAERIFATPWRLLPFAANGQPGFACYLRTAEGEPYRLGAVNVLTLRDGRIREITGFLDPELHRHLGLPLELAAPDGGPEK